MLEHLFSIVRVLGLIPNTKQKTTNNWSSILLFGPSSEPFKTEAH